MVLVISGINVGRKFSASGQLRLVQLVLIIIMTVVVYSAGLY